MPMDFELFSQCYLWNLCGVERGEPLVFSTSKWLLPQDKWDALYNALEQAHAEQVVYGR